MGWRSVVLQRRAVHWRQVVPEQAQQAAVRPASARKREALQQGQERPVWAQEPEPLRLRQELLQRELLLPILLPLRP